MAEQRADPPLSQLFDVVLSTEDGNSTASGYLLQDELLVRKWLLHGKDFVGKPVLQIVVPVKFRDEVLKTAHDQSGHLGIHKTYNYILRYFFWPHIKTDVSCFIKSCHACQMTGKPNQSIATAQPFEHLIIDYVGPLPRSKSDSSYLLAVM